MLVRVPADGLQVMHGLHADAQLASKVSIQRLLVLLLVGVGARRQPLQPLASERADVKRRRIDVNVFVIWNVRVRFCRRPARRHIFVCAAGGG